MPISRTGTLRAKSPRASARTPTPSNVSTPKFMPPSHYAAAGGYTPRQYTNQDAFPQGEHVRFYGKTPATTSYSAKGVRNLMAGGNSSRMSVAGHAPSDSESMLSNLEDHVPDLNELCGIKNGLPELEAQLLPSLRDTIDRMTGGSRIAGTRTGDRMRNHGTTKGLTGPWSTPTISDMRDHHMHSLGTNADSTRRHYHDTPTISYPFQSPELSRLKTPTKSALKSSLRSPSAKRFSTVGGTPETFHAAPSTLKSMKTLLSRKYSGKLRSPFAGHKATPDPPTPKKDPRIHSNDHLSSQQERVPDKLPSSRPRTSTSGHQSNIPRLRNRFHDGPNNDFYDNDSDLERRFEVESRRKLIVTNAEVLVSTSSSESGADAQKSRAAEVSRIKSPDSSRPGPIGLGLSLAQTTLTESRVSPQTRNEESRRYLNPGKTLRFSLPPSNSGESTYSDDFDNYDKPNAKNGQRRRQEPCDPVDTDLDFNSRHPFLRHHGNIQQNGNSYLPNPSNRSPSQSPVTIPSAGNERKETHFERGGYSDRRRSSSCGPSFRSSPQDTPRHTYHDPPRPRSSCQRHVARGEYTPDSEFPQSLKELIKHRNSFSKPGDVEQRDHPEPTSRGRRSDELDKKPGRKEKSAANSPRDTDPYFYNRSYVRHSGEAQEHWADANSDNESFRSVATRERLAFGIPPSESDEVFNQDLREPELSHADSDMSSINESIWEQAQDEMDFNSDRILRKMSDKTVEKDKARSRRHVQGATPQLNIISPTLSSESLTYEEREAPSSINHGSKFETTGPKFRTTPLTSEQNVGHQAINEILPTREGVIQEIFETEEDLLHLLRICMHLFVIPLRVQNSHTWITGVPPTVARLFDWFDDIVQLHEQIYGALCSARDTMSPATDRVSESLRWFVLRVEVYQPYLVRLADARTEIQGALEDQKCELGQFIRLQEMNQECQGWTLERLLMLPVNRLANYQDLFARMLDLTPKTHQDYLSTLSLARSTDIALKVMTEVKAREDEYNLLKQFSSRIQGLPTQNHLATRDRRLLHSGPLQLVISNLRELPCRTGTSPAETKRISRSSTLLDAIAKSPCDFAKSAVNPGSSWINGNDEGTTISTSSPSKVSWFSRLPLRRRSRKSPSRVMPNITDETAHLEPSVDLRTLDVHAFVFNDLVLLVQQNRSNVPGHSWILSEDVGIFRPLSIARLKRRSAQEGMILSLEVATVDPLGLNDSFNFRSSSWTIVDLLLPPPPSRGGVAGQVDVDSNDHFQPWLNSLRQCCTYILRNLTFITHPNQGETSSILGSDRLLDTHLVVSSLTASGLPIPRSPSGRLPETCSAGGGDRAPGSSDEREERGWWSLRYQQVFREFQRQDSGILGDEEEG